MRKLLSIGFIWFCCAIAWMVLGSSVVVRSGESSSAMQNEVQLLWGPALVQAPPTATAPAPRPKTGQQAANDHENGGANDQDNAQAATPKGQRRDESWDGSGTQPQVRTPASTQAGTAPPPPTIALDLDGSDIDVSLDLEHRRKGLMWFATYGVAFSGKYTFTNDHETKHTATLRFPLAGQGVVYDAFKVLDGEGEPVDATIAQGEAVWEQPFDAGESKSFTVVYRSRGTSSWTYAAGRGTAQLKDFKLSIKSNTDAIDFPAGTISPSSHSATANGWEGTWSFDSLVSSADIAVVMPQKLNPGPVVSRITFFAPVSLLFFFFVVAILAAARRKHMHPMHFFMLGTAFFAFHLLFAYLVDHVSVFPSFAAAAAVSVLLVISYARLFVGWRFALLDIGISQLVYLVLFSFTFFLKGFTGLAITIGAVLTLFVIMQITGRLDWSEAAALLRADDGDKKDKGKERGRAHVYGPYGAPIPAYAGMPVDQWQGVRRRYAEAERYAEAGRYEAEQHEAGRAGSARREYAAMADVPGQEAPPAEADELDEIVPTSPEDV